MPEPTTTIRLGPKAVARLAILGEQLQVISGTLAIEVRDDNAKNHAPNPAEFQPSAKLLRAAKLGLSRLVATEAPMLAGVTPEAAAKRLEALDVPADVALELAQPLVNARVLTNQALNPAHVEQAVTALVTGRGYSREA